MFEYLRERYCLSYGFDFNPNPLSFLGSENNHNESTLYASQTIFLITQLRYFDNSAVASTYRRLINF